MNNPDDHENARNPTNLPEISPFQSIMRLTGLAGLGILFWAWQIANNGFVYFEGLLAQTLLLFLLPGLIFSGVLGQRTMELQIITLTIFSTFSMLVSVIINPRRHYLVDLDYFYLCSIFVFLFVTIFRYCIIQDNGRTSLIWPQFRVRSLLVAVIYVAMVMSLGIKARKIADLARVYEQKLSLNLFHEGEWESRLFWELKADADAEFSRREAYRLASRPIRTDSDPATEDQTSYFRLQENEPSHQIQPAAQASKSDNRATRSNPSRIIKTIRHYSFLVKKYKAAIRRPWIPVPPDPSAPNDSHQ